MGLPLEMANGFRSLIHKINSLAWVVVRRFKPTDFITAFIAFSFVAFGVERIKAELRLLGLLRNATLTISVPRPFI
jgi:hypothetical protein